jgi:hypothetical protein
MRLNKFILAFLMTSTAVSARAYAQGEPGRDSIGKVNAVYVAAARGLLIEKKLLRDIAGKDIWVSVRGATMVASDATGELFKVPEDMAIEHGDLVATRIGDLSMRTLSPNLIATPNLVTQLVAPHDSLIALMFGLQQATPSMLSTFLGAKSK